MDGEELNASMMNPREELPSVVRQMTADRLLGIIDEAENGDTRDLFALYRDVIAADNQIQAEFAKRKGAVVADPIQLIAFDRGAEGADAAVRLCEEIARSGAFRNAQSWLLNATLYPAAVMEKVYRPAPGGYRLARLLPVNYQLLDYRTGSLRIFDVDAAGRPLPTAHDCDPARYIVHRGHMMPLPDQWGGPMRALLFWWLLRSMSRQWWADLLERFGVPFLKGKYADQEGRRTLERAFQMAVRLGAIVISKNTEVEVVQAAAGDTSNSHERFIELCNREISKLVVGQTLSGQAAPTGELGGGTASLQSAVRDDIRQLDAKMLAATFQEQLFRQAIALAGIPGEPPKIVFGSESGAERDATTSLIKSLHEAGLEPEDDALPIISERIGFGIRRASVATPMAFSASAGSVATAENSELSDAFTGRLAPLKRIILEAPSPEECVRRVKAWTLSAGVKDEQDVLEDALSAYAAKGLRKKMARAIADAGH